MTIHTAIDDDQTSSVNSERLVSCPACGHKLIEIRSLFRKGVFRQKCRRCHRYIMFSASE